MGREKSVMEGFVRDMMLDKGDHGIIGKTSEGSLNDQEMKGQLAMSQKLWPYQCPTLKCDFLHNHWTESYQNGVHSKALDDANPMI